MPVQAGGNGSNDDSNDDEGSGGSMSLDQVAAMSPVMLEALLRLLGTLVEFHDPNKMLARCIWCKGNCRQGACGVARHLDNVWGGASAQALVTVVCCVANRSAPNPALLSACVHQRIAWGRRCLGWGSL